MTAKTKTLPEDGLLPGDTRRSLPIALLFAREAVMARFRPLLAAEDFTEQQWRVLRVLAESGSLDATEIVRRACLLAPSLTRILRTLEARRLITRKKSGDDARRSLVDLTDKGRKAIEKIAPKSREVYDELERAFGPERIEALLDMLNDLAETKPS